MLNSLSHLICLQDDVQRVQKVFPHTPVKEIRSLVMEKGVCEAIEFLCEEGDALMEPGEPNLPAHRSKLSHPAHQSSLSRPSLQSNLPGPAKYAPSSEGLKTPFNLQQCISNHVSKVCKLDNEAYLTVDRANIWSKAKVFYKAAGHNDSVLKRSLVITFAGEPGIDCGALKLEYFTLLLSEINEKLFEGDLYRRVPRRDFLLDDDFVLAGMAVAHSIMQSGPAFPCLSRALYPLTLAEECGLWDDYLPTQDDIPKNASTETLLELID